MSWVMVAVGGGALAGGIQANEQKKDVRRQNRAQAEITRYSPWTGMQGKMQAEPSVMGGTLQGAMMGAMAGNAMGLGGKKDIPDTNSGNGMVSQGVSNVSSAPMANPVVQQAPSQGVSLMRPQGGGMSTPDYVEGLASGRQNPWGKLY